jgi:chemotaxis protein MotB
MKHQTNDPVIRVVKKNKHHGGHHGGAWKVAYADFVTAMMALFIVLWIVGQSKEIREYVSYYFRDPGAFSETTRGTGVLKGASLHAPRPAEEEVSRLDEQKQLTAVGEQIVGELNKNPALSQLLDQVKIEFVPEGLRIELMESSETVFFDVGTAVLKPTAVNLLATIAEHVGKLPNKVVVEGHSDSRQYGSVAGYTNFELSADRANSARRVLATQGLRPGQITEVRGYADSKLLKPDDPFDASNRRISIIILYETTLNDTTASHNPSR